MTAARRTCLAVLAAAGLTVLQAIASSLPAQEPGFTLVVHRDNPVASLSRKEVADIFLKRTARWPGSDAAIRPVDQPASAAVRDRFSRAILGKAPSAVVSYWQQQVFTGRGVPPVERPNDAAVLETVRGDPAAIGYIGASVAPAGLKVVPIRP